MNNAAGNWLTRIWYRESILVWVLWPLSWLYASVVSCRRFLFRTGIFRRHDVGVPVVVVGNILVGGTGKTPLTIWLANGLVSRGFSPGIVSRGYRGETGATPVEATPVSDPKIVGDEAILLSALSQCRVVVHPDRVAAAARAIELGADVIIADDGLQHYRLARDLELAVIDGQRGFGNGRLLPAGPLREGRQRLDSVDRIVVHRQPDESDDALQLSSAHHLSHFSLQPIAARRLGDSHAVAMSEFAGRQVHAVAGIGNPQRFFSLLESCGMLVVPHPLSDHADIAPEDVMFDDDAPVFMTAKDAVKCRFPEAEGCWCVDVEVEFEGSEGSLLLDFVATQITPPLVAK